MIIVSGLVQRVKSKQTKVFLLRVKFSACVKKITCSFWARKALNTLAEGIDNHRSDPCVRKIVS